MLPLFSLKDVWFKDIVHYPDIKIPEGGVTFICGESGCGKSTLLKLLNNVASPASGEILYADKRIKDYDPIKLRREVLLCGQTAFLFGGTVRENFIKFYKHRDLSPISDEEINKFLKICAGDFPLDASCGTMSGGEKHRVFMSVCLSLHPKVLLLDEPTSALDNMTADTLMSNTTTFCHENNITLIIVSHNTALAQTYADYIITLAGGVKRE
jgi:putative ABC transport system ATP-binding protein